jgi:uncharacterized protein (TIGR03437 family)
MNVVSKRVPDPGDRRLFRIALAFGRTVGFERMEKLASVLDWTKRIFGLVTVFLALSVCAQAQAPSVNAVVNAASSSPALAPGALVSIYGANLAGSIAQAAGWPLPTQLLDVNVAVNGAPLPLLYVSPGQINGQLPFNVVGSATVSVNTTAGAGAAPVMISDTAPAIFSVTAPAGTLPDVTHSDGSLVTSAAPAQPGEYLTIYSMGLGLVNGSITEGQPAPSTPPLSTMAVVQVQLGGAPVTPSFAGLAPGFAGLYQVNFQVPQLASGTYSMALTAGSATSNALPLLVSNPAPIQHYEYVFPDGKMYVYDMDNGFTLVKQVPIPLANAGIRGTVASPVTHTLYISYGGDGDGNGNGSMLAYDLIADQVLWSVDYPFGIDSMAVTPDGKTIYMPTGELNDGNVWNVMDASNGKVLGSINGGAGPHNTVVSLDGSMVYMGPRNDNYLYVASTATNTLIRRIGPMVSGVRPFTINGKQTLAFTTATGFLGFQVSDINSGKVLYTVPINGFSVPANFQPSTPSHGISLSPDEKEIWVMDAANSYVHVFDITGLPGSPPKQVADLKFTRPMTDNEVGCAYDCARDGWVQHSRDGRFVFIGDSGDVFDAKTRKPIINLDTLYNTRKHIEIDWQSGMPISSTSRHGLGYVTQ